MMDQSASYHSVRNSLESNSWTSILSLDPHLPRTSLQK